MSDTINSLADLLRSEDERNHAVAAAIASDEDFIRAVEVLYQEAKAKFENRGLPYYSFIFKNSSDFELFISFSSTMFEGTNICFQVGSWVQDKQFFTPDVREAALHLKKLLLCETSS